ncbi:hypothetical protein E2F98_08940 [Bacillus cereus]|nr:hypothetical protein E2F98_08940 [Bacillus cereus]
MFKKSGQDNLRMSSLHRQCGTYVGKLHSVSSWQMRLDLLGALDPPFKPLLRWMFKKSGQDNLLLI